uniref:Uncharacterized protein n=1 Tax=Lactuca sativa TaxID=4236 RepID=A0A9R1XKV0_LACSA|nr:hypothetical protein LSAT_V11C300119030 [Lactuca sativa]
MSSNLFTRQKDKSFDAFTFSYLRTILILQGGHINLKRSLKSIPTVTFSSDHKCLTIGKRMMVAGATGGSPGLIADALTEKDIHGSYTSGGWKRL